MLWNALWFKRNEPSKKHHLSLACRASKRLLASLLEVLGENRHSRPIRLVIHDPLRGDQLGSLRSARKKKPGAPPLVARISGYRTATIGMSRTSRRPTSDAIQNGRLCRRNGPAEGRKCANFLSVEREGSR